MRMYKPNAHNSTFPQCCRANPTLPLSPPFDIFFLPEIPCGMWGEEGGTTPDGDLGQWDRDPMGMMRAKGDNGFGNALDVSKAENRK